MKSLSSCVVALALAVPAFAQKPQPKPAPAQLSVTIQVTDREGAPLSDVAVTLAGPVDRSGSTGEQGTVAFRTLRAGTYRLRFEREDFITLEREIVLRAGQPADVSVALSPAPASTDAADAPPPPDDPPAVPGGTPARAVDPRTLSIPDFLDNNLIGGEPQRRTLLGCAEGGTARLLQIRDPLEGQLHAEVDEILYVIAGAGVLRIRNQDTKVGPGFFALVPRDVPHSLRRNGRNPLILLSIFAGSPCTDGDAGVR